MVVSIPPQIQEMPDRVSEMFRERTVLITGGSGFLGKILVEKILRCTDVKTVYLLLRDKKGKIPKERINEIFNNMLFDVLKKEKPLAVNKCKPISGDVSHENLGISEEDRKLLQEEVDFIFHSAASTRFDDTLRQATKINTRGTKYMLELAHQCKNLKIFVHISTAYAFPNEIIVKETGYDPPLDPETVLRIIDFKGVDETDEDVHKHLLEKSANTYIFSKALAESLVTREMGNLPIVVIRPSIVCPTYREPFAGWCNNLQGPMGLFVGAGKGVIRSMYVRGDCKADFIPADLVINGMILGAYVHLNVDKNQRFYNITASSENNKTWQEIIDMGREVVTKDVPFNGIVWYPGGGLKKSRLIHYICFFFLQIIPAIFIDLLLMVLGYKPILLQIQKRIYKASEMMEYFTTKQWDFEHTKAIGIKNHLNQKENLIYKLDSEGIDPKEYLVGCILGVRRNNLKETDDMLPAAKRNFKIMWFLDLIVKLGLTVAAFYYLYRFTTFVFKL